MTETPPLPFASILTPAREGGGRPYVLLPSRHRSAWLFPAGEAARAGLRSFGHSGVKGVMARALIAAKRLRGHCVWLDVAALERALAEALATPDVRLAFCIGTSGAYRKLTAQVRTRGDEILAYAKLAAKRPARDALRREHDTLVRLSTVADLRGAVPGVLGWFPWRDAQVLLVTAGSGQAGSGRLTAQHAAFLRRVHDASVHEERFESSAMWARMVGAVDRLAPRVCGAWPRRWHAALSALAAALGPVVLPLSLAHRDFAPWNTRLGPRGLFVFDWEAAADGTTPLYDLFHFHAVQAARRGRPLDLQRLPGILADGRPVWLDYLPHVYLAYLLDISLLYGEARTLAPQSAQGSEWQWFGRSLDTWERDPRAVA